jgi:tetratricopeptide (TPR) repeat protein
VLFAKWISTSAKSQPVVPLAVLSIITLIAANETIARNADWKSEIDLFTKDVKACPNSAKTNNNCGVVLINLSETTKDSIKKQQILREAVDKINKSLSIHPKYVDAWLNLGVAYSRLEEMDNMEAAWLEAKRQSPNHPKLKEYMKLIGNMFSVSGFKLSQKRQFTQAVHMYEKAIQYGCDKPIEAWYNLGGNYLMSGDAAKAKEIWTKVLIMDPNHTETKKWLTIISQPKGQIQMKDR